MAVVLFWFSILVFLLSSACSSGLFRGPQPITYVQYRLTLVDSRWSDRAFVIAVSASNAAGVESFERYLVDGRVTSDDAGNANIGIASSPVEECEPGANHAWNFCMDSERVTFSDLAAEVCDGSFEYIETNLARWIREVGSFCPWNTRRMVRTIEKNGAVIFERE